MPPTDDLGPAEGEEAERPVNASDGSQRGLNCYVEVVYRTTVLREDEHGKHYEERYLRRCGTGSRCTRRRAHCTHTLHGMPCPDCLVAEMGAQALAALVPSA